MQPALGQGQATGSSGALQQIAQEPFGQILLVLTGVGLFAYLVWRLIQAIADPDNVGSDAKGVIKRIGYAVSGLTHGALAFTASQLAFGSGGGGGGNAQGMTARLMQQPFGRWLVAIVGLIIVGAKQKFKRKLNLSQMKAKEETWALRAGTFGLIALGLIAYGIYMLVLARYRRIPAGNAFRFCFLPGIPILNTEHLWYYTIVRRFQKYG